MILDGDPCMCHRGGKSTWPDRDSNPGPRADRSSTLSTDLPNRNNFPQFDLIRNHAGTDETVPLLLAAWARTHTEPPNVTGEEKAHGPTGTRTQDLSQTVRALWPVSYRATRSTLDMSNIAYFLICHNFLDTNTPFRRYGFQFGVVCSAVK